MNAGQSRHLALEEAAFRDAARIEQIMTANDTSACNDQVVVEAMRCFDRAAILRRCSAELGRLAASPLADAARAAQDALTLWNGQAILVAAEALRHAAAESNRFANSAIAELVLASVALDPSQPATGSS